MPINNKKLQDIFGSDSSENDENMSSELDIADDADDNGFPLNLNAQDDDDLIPPAPVFRDPEALPVTQKAVDSDIDYALRTQCNLINQSQQLIEIALKSSADGGTSADIKAAAEAINTATNAVEKLIALHEKLQKIKAVTPEAQPAMTGNTLIQNQVIYNGTTADILKQLSEGTIDVNNL